MRNSGLLAVVILSVLMAACGSNDGRGSSSSSSVAAITCNSFEGAVFIDDVCSSWQDVSAYEQLNQSPWTGSEITDGSLGKAVTFTVIDSADSGRRQVLDIDYASVSSYSGVVRMRAPDNGLNGVDMSEYAAGKLQFDIKLIDEGIESPDLELVIECGYPCGNTPKIVKPKALNQWQTFEYSVADLIDRGLDIEHVGLGFMLSPTWGKQAGVHFQVDNIRWVEGTPTVATQEICFANYFDTPWIQSVSAHGVTIDGGDFMVPNDQLMNLTQGVNPYIKAVPDWSQMQGQWTYSFSERISYTTGELLESSTLSLCSSAGVLSLDVYVSEGLVDDGTLTFTIHFVDEDSNIYELPGSLLSVSSLTPGDWNRVSVNLSAQTQYDNLKYVGLSIDSTDVDEDLDAYFYVDNILIKQNISASSTSIDGVWDESSDGDEIYLVVKDGVWIEYDYLGDSFDMGPNCFTSYALDVEKRGESNYRVYYPDLSDSEYSDVSALKVGNNLNFEIIGTNFLPENADDFAPVGYKFTYSPSALAENDFVPLCDSTDFGAEAGYLKSLIKL